MLRLDDIIRRLTPSLADLAGCSIIDFNPGVGLWSSKLHDALKPRSHVLVEQDQNFYQPFLKPLLDAPGSRYHLRSWNDTQPWKPDSYVSEGLIPELDKASIIGGRNNSLLIIANLAFGSKRKVRGLSPSQLNIYTYIRHLRSQLAFHAHGSVRLLLWMPDSEKSTILPRTVSLRKKLSVGLEMGCHVEEIAGGSLDNQIATIRESFLEIESSKRVAERMKALNIQIPFSRQDVAKQQLYGDFLNIAENNSKVIEDSRFMTDGARRLWHIELKQLEQEYRDKKFPRLNPSPSLSKDPSPYGRKERSQKYYRLAVLRAHFNHQDRVRVKADELIQIHEAIERLHCDILNKVLNEPERQRELTKLQQLSETLKVHLGDQSKTVLASFKNNTDNRRAFRNDPPLLLWDRRTAEPLAVHEEEFHNPTSLVLLDFQPLSPNPYPITSAQSATFDLVVGGLLNHLNDTIYCLDSLAPGAADAIISRVSALQDPHKGGRYDLSDFRVRCFTPEMIYEIFQAWDNWAFKPQISEMVAGSEAEGKQMMY